jgi:FHS family Na+ dependent glucose MFS transporter 1
MSGAGLLPSQFSRRAKLRVAMAFYAAILFEGMMLAIPGPTLDSLAEQSSSSLGEIGLLFTGNGLGFVTGALLAGRLYSRLKGSYLMAGSVTAMGLLALTIPWLGSLTAIVGVFVLIGFSIGMIDVGGNTLIVWLYREEVPPFMNALHLSFGIGAFLAPLVVAQVALATGEASAAYWLVGALMIPIGLWLVRVPSPDLPEHAQPGSSSSVMRSFGALVALMALLFFLHVGAELAFGGWIFSYADTLGIGPETTARLLNSIFWGGLVVGRLVAIPLSLRATPRAMILMDLAGAAVGLGVIAFIPGWTPALWIGTALFGISIASIFASCINYAERHMPITSQVTAIFLVGGSLGSMTLPWLVGRLFEADGPEAMLYVVGTAIAAGIVLFGAIQVHVSRRHPSTSTPASSP